MASRMYVRQPPDVRSAATLRPTIHALLFILACVLAVAAQPDVLLMHKLGQGSFGSCADGSPQAVYYRNCTGNWDSKGPDFCNVTDHRWVVYFGELSTSDSATASGEYCYDLRSCASRSPNLTSSRHLPATLYPDGIASVAAEVNPNLYLQTTVVVPYCTSDLFIGRGNSSRSPSLTGALNVDIVLQSLFSSAVMPGPTMAAADSVVLIGGAGVMARIDDLASALVTYKRRATGNASAELNVYGVCTGCLLFEPSPAFAEAACTTDANCEPSVALPRLAALAGDIARPSWCSMADAWECFTAPSIQRAMLTSALRTPMLVTASQYDARALASLGVPSPITGTGLAWAETVYAPAVRSSLGELPFPYSPACVRPSAVAALTRSWFQTRVPHLDSFNHTTMDAASVAASSFLEAAAPGGVGPASFGSWMDDCAHLAGCNPSDCAE